MTRLLILLALLLPSLSWGQSYHSLTTAADIASALQDNAASTAIVNANGTGGTLAGAGNTSASSNADGPNGWLPRAITIDGTDDRVEYDKPAAWADYPFSYGVWAKLNAASGEQYAVSLFPTGSSTVQYTIASVRSSKPTIIARNTTFFGNAAVADATTNWTFLSASFESATSRKLYVNGVLAATQTDSVSLNAGATRLSIGRLRDSGTSLSMAGKVAGFTADGVSWSAGDHAQLYAGPEPKIVSDATITQNGMTVAPVYNDYSNGDEVIQYQWQEEIAAVWTAVSGQTNPDNGPADWGATTGTYRLVYEAANNGGTGDSSFSNEVDYVSSIAPKVHYYRQLHSSRRAHETHYAIAP